MSHEQMLHGDKQPWLSPTIVLTYHKIGLFTQYITPAEWLDNVHKL